MTQKHDSMDSLQDRYKKQTKYPLTNSETTNPEFTFIRRSSPSDVMSKYKTACL